MSEILTLDPNILSPNIGPDESATQAEARNTRAFAEVGAIGDIAFEGIGVEVVGFTEEDFDTLTLVANGVDIRPEDKDRVHDVGMAYEEATRENEMFDLYTEALAEDKRRSEEAAKEQDESVQPEEKQADPDMDSKNHNATSAPEGSTPSLREQAEAAMKSAGLKETLPLGIHVRREVATGNLIIPGKNSVRIIEPKAGNGPRITEYRFDDSSGVLTIRSGEGSVLVRSQELVAPSGPASGDRINESIITLPPAVARIVGFKRAVPLEQRERHTPQQMNT